MAELRGGIVSIGAEEGRKTVLGWGRMKHQRWSLREDVRKRNERIVNQTCCSGGETRKSSVVSESSRNLRKDPSFRCRIIGNQNKGENQGWPPVLHAAEMILAAVSPPHSLGADSLPSPIETDHPHWLRRPFSDQRDIT